MTREDFLARLTAQPAVKLTRRQWAALGKGFEATETHDTGLAGALRVGRLEGHLVAVEEASSTHLAVRALASTRAAQVFIQQRLQAYDRMWDG